MKILIACEFSGIIREEFIKLGHEAVSCDLLDTEIPGPHLKDDVRNHLGEAWDMMIAHPPCTYLAVSGARWFKDRQTEQEEALTFVQTLMDADIPRICIENPISIISTRIRRPDQIIQPWMFGHGEVKATCLWLKNLSSLTPTEICTGRYPATHYASPSPDRWKVRSRTYTGIAKAMATQWGTPDTAQ